MKLISNNYKKYKTKEEELCFIEDLSSDRNVIRKDVFGNAISKGAKYRVSFRDQINKNKSLLDIVKVESFKEYNIIPMDSFYYYKDNDDSEKVRCKCDFCVIY